jgi:hypothetical protein
MLAVAVLPSGAAEQHQKTLATKEMTASCPKTCRSLGNCEPLTTPLRLNINLMPLNKTAVEPPDERDLAYSVEITNSSTLAVWVDVWAEVELPSGKMLDPILLKQNLRLPAGLAAAQEINHRLPKSSPAGIYTISLQMGTYPDAVLAGDKLSFEIQSGEIRELKSVGNGLKREGCNSEPACSYWGF